MDIQRVGQEGAAAALEVTRIAMLLPAFTPGALASRAAAWGEGRSWGAFDGARIVGHARALDLETTVPGGARVATAGVSAVGVLPTHTRRGLLRQLMAAVLDDARQRRVVIASLRASQAPIYGRFGFGLAGLYADYEIAGGEPLRSDAIATRHHVEVLTGGLRRTAEAIYEQVGCLHTGAVTRPGSWWDRWFGDLDDPALEQRRWVASAVDEAGTPAGYVLYEVTRPASGGVRLVVQDLVAADPDAYRALWAFLLDIDLVTTVVAERRPVDEPLRWMLEDPRSLTIRSMTDEQWVRLVDVEAALAARRYAPVGESVVVEITDGSIPANSGRYRIGPDRAVRIDGPAADRRDGEAAELAGGVAELGALYLGGVRATDLVRAGRLGERRPGAAEVLDRLLAIGAAPWCGTFF